MQDHAVALVSAGILAPNEVREWLQAWDAVMSGEVASHRVLCLPGEGEITILPARHCRYCKSVASGARCETCGAPW